jgi:single-strand DNA-binding protein
MDAYVQLTGNVGGTVEFRNNTVPVASFRLAHTPRVRRNGEWADAPTTWITVTCFRALAENVKASLHKGHPVLVAGRLRTNVWTKDGVTYERLTLEATTVGHDLTRGTATFFRAATESTVEDREDSLREVIGRVESQPVGDGMPQEEVESFGEPSDEEPEERIDVDGVVSQVA